MPADSQMSKEAQLIILMLQDMKKDFKDHADNVFERINGLQCAAQNVRLDNAIERIEELEAAPAKRSASLVSWCAMLMSGILGLFEFLRWKGNN